MAFNLPNDGRIVKERGTAMVMLKISPKPSTTPDLFYLLFICCGRKCSLDVISMLSIEHEF